MVALCALVSVAYPQTSGRDTTIAPSETPDDSLFIDYDDLFRDFESFMDSILTPRSFLLANLGVGKGYFNFDSKNTGSITTSRKLRYSPTLAYYHKKGLGMNFTGYIIDDNENLNFYQWGLSPSFDYLEDRRMATGISYTRYFTKDSLPFYTTPLLNEIYAYFMYRALWFKPSVSASYGWGNRSEYREREFLLQDLRLRRQGYIYVNTIESIRDFMLTASVRHDFYFLDVIANRDHIRMSPQLAFTSGTQRFGFNQSTNTFGTLLRNGSNVLFSTENVYLDDVTRFQPLSFTFLLRSEYSIGNFFLQPQFLLDYYFPGDKDDLNAFFSLNLGYLF